MAGAAYGVRAQDLRFQVLTTDDGLSDNAVTCVFEDRAGLIWVGTENGLDTYDGQLITPVAGARYSIAGITQDAQGTLWVATKDHGLLRIDAGDGSVEHLRHDGSKAGSIASDQLTTVFDLNDTTLLIGSRELTLIFMDKRTRAFSYWADSLDLSPARALKEPPGQPGWCHSIQPLNERYLWVGLLNLYTALLVDRTNNKIVHHLITKREATESQTCALLHKDRLFTGGWQNGMDVAAFTDLPKATKWPLHTQVIPTPDEVLTMVPWENGGIVAGTRAYGLMLLDPANGSATWNTHRRSDPNSIPSDRIRCLFVDHAGSLWVGTSNGLAVHVPKVWNMHVDRIFDARDDEQPELFFHRLEPWGAHGVRAYTSKGFYLYDQGRITHLPVTTGGMDLQPTVSGMDPEGGILLGTEYGILRYADLMEAPTGAFIVRDGSAHAYSPGTMYQVRYLQPDRYKGRDVIIVGALGFDLYMVDARSGGLMGVCVPTSAMTVKARSLVTSVARDRSGTYWVSTGDGIYKWNATVPLKQYATRSSAPRNDSIIAPGTDVRQLLLRGDTAWAVARGGVLLRIIGDHVLRYTTNYSSSTWHGLAFDQHGRLWITTNDGLLRFDPKDGSFIHVPVNDGREFRKLTRAITALPDGRMAFAADNAIMTFDPDVYAPLPSIPDPYVTSASVAGAITRITNGTVQLSYRASVIDIGISAMAFGFPRPLVFEYRMDGVESEWRAIKATEPIRYAGVPVGDHRLLVRVRDPFGRTGAERELLTISVAGPFWQQWWFYAVAAVVISAGVYAWARYRLIQALKLQAVRNRIASDLHDEVGSSLSSITIGSQLARQLSTGDNEKVKAIMARIGETSSESLRSMSDIVWAIDPKNDQGEALVKRMRRIAQELLESKSVDVVFRISGGVEELKLPMNARKDLLLIFKEAVHNASKYAEAGSVSIELIRSNGSMTLSVKDDGKGFDLALHPDGHGLGSMQRRAQALGSTLELVSAQGAGTSVRVEVDLTRIRD